MDLRLEEKIYGHFMNCVPGFGLSSVQKMLLLWNSAKEIYECPDEILLKEGGPRIGKNKIQAFLSFRRERNPLTMYEELGKKAMEYVPITDPLYPDKLRQITVPPVGLYVRGSLPKRNCPSIGIVGARICSDYGRHVARVYGAAMAENGIEVVSGMAAGIDGIAQKAALVRGRSYAVLGCGADVCYPEENRSLFTMLPERGGVISEFIPGTQPKSGLFPLRNRIIAGLSDALLVVEAREKSGTLITVDRALEQGKEVFAVPGRVTEPLSSGCNRLISQGATMALSPKEVADAIWKLYEQERELVDIPCEVKKPRLRGASPIEEGLYDRMELDRLYSADELIDMAQNASLSITSMSQLCSIMMQLQLKNVVEMVGGRYRVKGE